MQRSNNQLRYAGITLHLRTKRFVKIPLRLNLTREVPESVVNNPYELIRDRLASWRVPRTENAAPVERRALDERVGRGFA